MTIDEFWRIIDGIEPSSFDMAAKCDRLKKALLSLSPNELRDFVDLYFALKDRAYRWPLWDAAYIMHDGCGDDSFMDFRSALITFGKDVYERALAEPDSLAELAKPVPRSEEVFGVIYEAIEEKLGANYQPTTVERDSPIGESIEDMGDYETQADERFPKLREQARQREAEERIHSNRGWKWWLDVFTFGLCSKLKSHKER